MKFYLFIPKQDFILYYAFPVSAKCLWYDFHPGHHFVCHLQNHPINDFGLASAFFRIAQFSQLNSFSAIIL